MRGGIRAVLLLKSSLYLEQWLSQNFAVDLFLEACKTSGDRYFKVIPRPCGHLLTYLIHKCLWAPPLTDLTIGLWWDSGGFYFLYTWWYVPDFPQRTYIASEIWKKENDESTRDFKIAGWGVKWVTVCWKKLTSFSSFSM